MNAQQLLEQLTEAYARRDLMNIEQAQEREAAIPEEVRDALTALAEKFTAQFEPLNDLINTLEAKAKDAVLAEGSSVKGGALHAIYAKGRVSWDSKKLDGMMIIIPELSQARKEGEPSVSIRKVG